MATRQSSAAKKLTPPQKLSTSRRTGAVEGVAPGRARAIAAKEPIAPRIKRGKTAKPLVPERVAAILDALRKTYPNVVCALVHHNAFELTIATILSAQTTDAGVNKATPELFRRFPTPKALASAPPEEIEQLVKTTGFYRAKTRNIQARRGCSSSALVAWCLKPWTRCWSCRAWRARRRMWCWARGSASPAAWWSTPMCTG